MIVGKISPMLCISTLFLLFHNMLELLDLLIVLIKEFLKNKKLNNKIISN